MVRSLRQSCALRLCSAALAAAAIGGAARAEALDLHDAAIGQQPWDGVALLPAFAADDAYVFEDVARPARLEADALALAVRGDLDRLARPAAAAERLGRIGGAFAGFAAYGGAAYASLGLTPEIRPTAVAQVPTFSATQLAMRAPLR